MKKVFFLSSVLIIAVLSSCEPAHPGGGDVAPVTNHPENQVEMPTQHTDSSIEKSLMDKNIDSIEKK